MNVTRKEQLSHRFSIVIDIDGISADKIIQQFRDLPIYLFINNNTITNYTLIIYELSNLDHTLGVVSQTRASSGNRTHDAHAKLTIKYNIVIEDFA